jgi:hypothetical protein
VADAGGAADGFGGDGDVDDVVVDAEGDVMGAVDKRANHRA